MATRVPAESMEESGAYATRPVRRADGAPRIIPLGRGPHGASMIASARSDPTAGLAEQAGLRGPPTVVEVHDGGGASVEGRVGRVDDDVVGPGVGPLEGRDTESDCC